MNQSQPSIFVSHPSYHNFTQDVAIMNVDIDAVSYSSKLMQLLAESFINPAEKIGWKVLLSGENQIIFLYYDEIRASNGKCNLLNIVHEI